MMLLCVVFSVVWVLVECLCRECILVCVFFSWVVNVLILCLVLRRFVEILVFFDFSWILVLILEWDVLRKFDIKWMLFWFLLV